MNAKTTGIAAIAVGATIAGLLAAAAPASAAIGTRFVSTTGVDAGTCSTRATACATINYAIGQANSGNTVKVAAGTYNQTVVINKPVRVRGAGASTTTLDGSGIDPGTPYYGVVYVGDTGGSSTVSGFTITNPAPFAQTGGEPEAIALHDTIPTDTVTISDNVITLGSDPNAATDFPIGIDGFVNYANTFLNTNTIDGFFQGILLEDNGPSDVRANTFQHGISGFDGSTTYAAEGLFFLSDLAGDMSSQVARLNVFKAYSGYGVAMSAGYDNGNCSTTPCDGSMDAAITNNTFALTGGSSGASAIALHASHTGNVLTADVDGNHGYTTAPNHALSARASGGGELDVTYGENLIHVHAAVTAAAHATRLGGLHVPARG